MNKKEYQKKYYEEHKKALAYYYEHRDEALVKHRQWYKEHRDEALAYRKQWYQQNKDKHNQRRKMWAKNHKGQQREIDRRHNSKRKRGLGFIPLNEPFEGSEAHHIDEERVIYIPKEYHQSVRHNVWTGRNMALINNLAYDYLLETKISVAQGGA